METNSYEESMIFNNDGPISLLQRLDYVKQLVFSRTKLEFKLLWNKIFQKEDEELGWLLNPYRQGNNRDDATMMSQFNRNFDQSYQCDYEQTRSAFGHERITIYNRSVAKKTGKKSRKTEEKSLADKALDYARYMGMGVYMTSTVFPSPYLPVSDNTIYEDTFYAQQNMYGKTRLW